MSDRGRRRLALARLLSSAVISQALLSAASFAIGLILIRRASDQQYGSYILAAGAIALLVSLQNAFCSPPLASRIHPLDRAGRGDLVGGLYREQRRLFTLGGALALLLTLVLWSVRVLDGHSAPLVLVTLAATLAVLHREYFRMVMFALRRPHDVLRTDVAYVALLVAGVWGATLSPVPAVGALTALGLAALASGLWLSQGLRRREPWNLHGERGLLREIAPLAAWSTAGAAIHWTFSQGYVYLVAATLDVAAVAEIAATRLLLMPVNLLSTGIGSLMLPLAALWLQQLGAAGLLRRLAWFALGMAVVTLAYFGLLWLARDWIFDHVLRKHPAQRDGLLLLWGSLFLVMMVRDQLLYLLAAQGRFRALTLLTLASALIALAASYAGMQQWGVAGALAGMLIGELGNLAGIVLLSLRQRGGSLLPGQAATVLPRGSGA